MTEIWIEIGILALLVYLPLDFGGVTPRAMMILEIGSAGLCLLWLLAASPGAKRGRSFSTQKQGGTRLSPLFWGALLLFLSVIFLQRLPLPAPIVKQLSPAAYELYAEGASATGSALPRFIPLSVCPQATEEDFRILSAYAAIFFLVLTTIRTRRQRKRLLYTIFLIGFIEAFYGLIQFISGNHSLYTRQVSSWVHGTFVNKNHFAAYMEMSVLLVFGLLVARFEAASNDTETPPEEKYIKAFFFGFVLVLMMSAHVLSGSRGGFISLTVGMLCFLLLASLRGLSGKKFSIVLLFFLLTIGAILVLQAERILPRLGTLTQGSVNEMFPVRRALQKDAVSIFEDYPAFGSGSDTFSHLFRRYRSFRSSLIYGYAENDYVQLLSESGILGTGLLLAAALLFFSHAFGLWKRRRSRWSLAVTSGGLCALLSLLLHALVDFLFHIPANAMLFVVIAAMCAAGGEGRGRRTEGARAVLQRSLSARVLIIGLLLLLYIVSAARTYSAYRHSQSASDLLSESEGNKAPLDVAQRESIIKNFQTAVRRDRNHAGYSAALGNFFVEHPDPAGGLEGSLSRENNFSLAESSLKRAVMLDPANPWHYYALGNLSYRRGDCEGVEWQACPVTHYFSSAFKNAPKNIFLRKSLGAWYYYFDRDVAS
ncbi:MAG: O-antigen ligase family protein, partial [bacterium]|nr:O-antigen ligase family protein [bacterium]